MNTELEDIKTSELLLEVAKRKLLKKLLTIGSMDRGNTFEVKVNKIELQDSSDEYKGFMVNDQFPVTFWNTMREIENASKRESESKKK